MTRNPSRNSLETLLATKKPLGRSPHLIVLPQYYSEQEAIEMAELVVSSSQIPEGASVKILEVEDSDEGNRAVRSLKINFDGQSHDLSDQTKTPEDLLGTLTSNVWIVKVQGQISQLTMTSFLYFVREAIPGGTFIVMQGNGLEDAREERSSLELLTAMKQQVLAAVTKQLSEVAGEQDPEKPVIERGKLRQLNRHLIHFDPVCLLELTERFLADESRDIEKVAAEMLADFLSSRLSENEIQEALKALRHLCEISGTSGEIETDDLRTGLLALRKVGLVLIVDTHFTSNSKLISELAENKDLAKKFFKLFK